MKAINYFKSVWVAAIVYLFALTITVGISSCGDKNESSTERLEIYMNQLKEIHKKIAILQSKKSIVMKNLAQAKYQKEHGQDFSSGLDTPSMNGITRINYLEAKIKHIDRQISHLEEKEKVILANVGSEPEEITVACYNPSK